jgi:hypothetical protein
MSKFLMSCLVPALAFAQDYRGTVRPVDTERPSSAIAFSDFRFNSLVFAHEGPDYFPIKTAPVIGREYMVDAEIFAIEEVTNIRFELLDELGQPIQTLILWKTSDAAGSGQFVGLLTVPTHPFRCIASGTDRRGIAFRRSFSRLFRPVASSAPESDPLPAGMNDPRIAGQLQTLFEKRRQATRARSEEARRAYPGGVINLARVQFLGMTYEPFVSPKGNVLGVRLRYRFQPSVDTIIAAVPHVFPWYQAWDWRSVVGMKAVQGSIDPQPEAYGVASVSEVILYNARARYRAGITYSITVDLAPDYVIQGQISGAFCMYEAKFNGRARTNWEAIRESVALVKYPVSITDVDFSGEIPLFYPQHAFYEGLVNEGARDCGPTPTTRF